MLYYKVNKRIKIHINIEKGVKMNKTKEAAYKKRQMVFLIIIGAILTISILMVIYFTVFCDKKSISQSPNGEYSAVPAGGQEESIDSNSIKFAENSITIEVGEKITPEFNIGGPENISYWESSNKSVAVVSENGEITGIGVGTAKISAAVHGTDKLISLSVNVVEEKTSESGNLSTKGYEIVEEDGITYIYGIMMASKSYSLPEDFDPGVNEEALNAFNQMQEEAANEGLDIYISSSYRSYSDQERIYNGYVEYDGKEAADTYSSRPGYSDHQTGMAFDLNSIDDSFGYTAESDWVKENAHKYGFIIRYPEGKEDITGYQYEPWHIRYIGVEKATEVYESGLCLEEFLGVDSVYADTKNESADNAENEGHMYSEE